MQTQCNNQRLEDVSFGSTLNKKKILSNDVYIQTLNLYLPEDLTNIVYEYFQDDGRMSFEIEFVPHESLANSKDVKVRKWLGTVYQEKLKKSISCYIEQSNIFYNKKELNLGFNVFKIKNFNFKISMFFQTHKKNNEKKLLEFYTNIPNKISNLWNEIADENYSIECRYKIGELYIPQWFNAKIENRRKDRLAKNLDLLQIVQTE
jgi:hypothetical protein